MKAGFVAAATAAALALLPAGAGAIVVTPDVVTPQVVTPHAVTPASPGATSAPSAEASPEPTADAPMQTASGDESQGSTETPPPPSPPKTPGPGHTPSTGDSQPVVQYRDDARVAELQNMIYQMYEIAGIPQNPDWDVPSNVVFIHGLLSDLGWAQDQFNKEMQKPPAPNQSFPEPNSSPAPEPEPDSSPAPEPTPEQDCQCSLPEGGGGARPLDDQLDQEEE